jgi:hypothetical protein
MTPPRFWHFWTFGLFSENPKVRWKDNPQVFVPPCFFEEFAPASRPAA